MTTEDKYLKKCCYCVLFPAWESIPDQLELEKFLNSGGAGFVLAESRQEYLDRKMSNQRLVSEKPEHFSKLLTSIEKKFGKVIIAVDYENNGINRLEGFTINGDYSNDTFKKTQENAKIARQLHINCFLGPVADVVEGENLWLRGRNEAGDAEHIAQITKNFILGAHSGGVKTITKHFPGYSHLPEDPAEADTTLTTSRDQIIKNISPFVQAVKVCSAIMIGPASVEAFDKNNSACTSSILVEYLKTNLDHQGLIVSDDLDAPATLKGKSIEDTAVLALSSGIHLLLLSAQNDIDYIAEHIYKNIMSGELDRNIVIDAAKKVRHFAIN